MSIPEVFAELFNYALGQCVVEASTLQAVDTRETATVDALLEILSEGGDDRERLKEMLKVSMERFRDVKMLGKTKDGGRVLYVCVENQSEMEDDMRERINLYNAISYLHAKNENGRIMVITCCIGWGSESFEREMYAFDDYGENLEPGLEEYLPYYKIPVVNIKDIPEEDNEKFSPDLRAVVSAVKLRESEYHSKDYDLVVEEIMKMGHNIGVKAQELVYAFCGINTKEGDFEMGTGLIDFFEDVKRRSNSEGKAEIVKNFMQKTGYSFDVACELLGITGDSKKAVEALC